MGLQKQAVGLYIFIMMRCKIRKTPFRPLSQATRHVSDQGIKKSRNGSSKGCETMRWDAIDLIWVRLA